jgi:hypothetical protein
MKKESITAKKSTHNSKKLKDRNNENSLIKTNSDNENLLIATQPPEITIPLVGGERWTTNEHYPQRLKVRRIKRSQIENNTKLKPNRKTNTALVCIGEDVKSVEQFDREEIDIKIDGTKYRIIFDKKLKKVWCREIHSFDHTGRPLFRNPAYDEEKTKRIIELFNDGKTPDEQLRFTARIIAKGIKKAVDNHFAKSDTKPKTKGRPAEQYLRDATFWAISNRQSKESKPKVAERAFELFEKEATSKDALKTAILRIWNEAYAKFKIEKEKMDIKNHFTFKKFAKTYLKIKQKRCKQRTKVKT